MLVKLKEILTKMHFYTPLKFWHWFILLTHNIHTIFGPNLVPCPRYTDNKYQIFSFTLYPPGAQNRSFELWLYTDIQADVQMQMITFRCPPSCTPPPLKTVQKWLEWLQKWGQTYSTFMYEGPSHLSGAILSYRW